MTDNNSTPEPTPVYDSVVADTGVDPLPEEPANKKWYEHILTPKFRKWAYGVTAAAVIAGSVWAGKPEFAATAAPLIMAIFYVDNNGEPR